MPHRRIHFLKESMCFVLFSMIICNDFTKVNAVNNATKNDNFIPMKDEFSHYTIIDPQIYDANNISLEIEKAHQTSAITLIYHYKGHRVHIDLKLNDDLLPEKHFLRFQKAKTNLSYTIQNITKIKNELCHYQGSIRGRPSSKVAVSTCNGRINGVVIDSEEAFIIHADQDDNHFLLRSSDLGNRNISCGHNAEDVALSAPFDRRKRSPVDINLLHGPYRSNKQSLYVELIIVVDNGVYKFFEENMGKVYQYCKDVANIMSALYASLNVFVILTGVIVWNAKDEIEYDDESRETLHKFLEYRSKNLSPEYPNDHAQLLTKKKFNDNIVGKAFVGPMCTHEKSGAVCMIHSPITAVVANTMAHEMGHTFGMAHDASDCKCPDKKCIMSDTSSSYIPTQWSSCSIDSFNRALSRGVGFCLRNKPTKYLGSAMCGNGFLEPGEECDCGPAGLCKSKCCDPNTCRLFANATCASGECCDMKSCSIKSAGVTCRKAISECDLTEFCNGDSEFCPKDVYKRDTSVCANSDGYCYNGQCGSHENSCRILWGKAAMNMEHCYEFANSRGDNAGNCGFNFLTNEIKKCEKENVKCGRLQCSYPPEWDKFGIAAGAQYWMSYALHKRRYIECRTARFDFGLHTPDPGLTPNGAKCGAKRMCLDQKCIPIEKLAVKSCPDDCNGNGICNSEGNCHCDVGFSGSSCRAPGAGGSIDSGPATNPSFYDAFKRFLYIFFFGVIPFSVLLYALIYFYRNFRYRKQKKAAKPNAAPFSDVRDASANSSLLDSTDVNNISESPEGNAVTPGTSSNSVDERNLQKVHKSIGNLRKNFENSFELKSASNYELSTLASSTKTLARLNQKVKTPIISKKSFKSDSTLMESSNKGLKLKLEITDVHLQSSTNPLAVALSDDAALVGNSSFDIELSKSKLSLDLAEDIET